MIVLVFTSSYPFDDSLEQTFLETEIEILKSKFARVILVPKSRVGNRLLVTAKVEVDETYSSFLRDANRIRAGWMVASASFFYRDLFANPLIWSKPSALARLIAYTASARLTCDWVETWFKRQQVDDAQVIFYTYWFDSATMGIGLARKKYPRLKLVSRAHGYDLYEDRYPIPYLPCRPQALALTDAVLPDSDAGEQYLKGRYAAYESKIEAALLGVEDTGRVSEASRDGVFRIVSCAVIRPVKRVDLILESVAYVARLRPSQRFEWYHFGNSQMPGVREDLQQHAQEILPANAKAFLPGYSNQRALLNFYLGNPVDVFVNLSESEGTPVSIMEAISCGLPVIATAVGGNREIVSPHNGVLLGPNPQPDDVAQALFWYIDHPADAETKRRASRTLWAERYNARRNFEAFADRLIEIRNTE